MGDTHVISKRIINFNAGPAALPLSVLQQIQAEFLNYQSTGMSVMEMSHRSVEFEEILTSAQATLRQIMAIPDTYEVLFLQGGASLQFSMVPQNIKVAGKAANLINTGIWTQKALEEIQKETSVKIIASSEDQQFLTLPKLSDIQVDPNASFAYMASNNTIFGTQFKAFPKTGLVPLVCDMSSDILSRQVDVSDFGLIFAGAQKNIGPSGLTIVIIRKDLAERCDKSLATMMQYRTHIKAKSLYNTPPSFPIYVAKLVFDWIQNQGGLSVVQENNERKGKLLYDAINHSEMFYSPIEESSRSLMNVVFRIKGNHVDLEDQFVKDAEQAGIVGIKGHRSVGGLRASIYNAQSLENVEAFIEFMQTFEKNNHIL